MQRVGYLLSALGGFSLGGDENLPCAFPWGKFNKHLESRRSTFLTTISAAYLRLCVIELIQRTISHLRSVGRKGYIPEVERLYILLMASLVNQVHTNNSFFCSSIRERNCCSCLSRLF